MRNGIGDTLLKNRYLNCHLKSLEIKCIISLYMEIKDRSEEYKQGGAGCW